MIHQELITVMTQQDIYIIGVIMVYQLSCSPLLSVRVIVTMMESVPRGCTVSNDLVIHLCLGVREKGNQEVTIVLSDQPTMYGELVTVVKTIWVLLTERSH